MRRRHPRTGQFRARRVFGVAPALQITHRNVHERGSPHRSYSKDFLYLKTTSPTPGLFPPFPSGSLDGCRALVQLDRAGQVIVERQLRLDLLGELLRDRGGERGRAPAFFGKCSALSSTVARHRRRRRRASTRDKPFGPVLCAALGAKPASAGALTLTVTTSAVLMLPFIASSASRRVRLAADSHLALHLDARRQFFFRNRVLQVVQEKRHAVLGEPVTSAVADISPNCVESKRGVERHGGRRRLHDAGHLEPLDDRGGLDVERLELGARTARRRGGARR